MRNKKRARTTIMSEINITPFTDVVLVLLIIFMITTPMLLQPGIKVNLPSTQTQEDMDETNIEVLITKNGGVLINGTQIHPSNISATIQNLVAKYPNKPVIVKGDKDVRYDDVIHFMDLARQAGASRFALAVDVIPKTDG
ncbi:MAG: biopolymer transporter ExbD [Elusimicrobiota bacterium]|jgi:biopolymer transport protein ExbD|nr:biopolymer transporter ExbD [Elusimicrobiota bacterium]